MEAPLVVLNVAFLYSFCFVFVSGVLRFCTLVVAFMYRLCSVFVICSI